MWIQYDKDNIFKIKRFGKKEAIIRKDKCLFMIITT